jgi:uncharacterized protein
MRILSVDGGGYLGLATAAFIAGVEDHFKLRFHERFELFCGTSTGGIIALALAAGKTGKEVVNLYTRLGDSVFRRRRRLVPWPLFRATYSNVALAAALTDVFGDRTIGDVLASGKKLLIPTFCTTTGQARIFKTDHSADLSQHNLYLLRNVALATSAAPTYFPLVRLQDPKSGAVESFCDGGVVANHPALMGFAEAISALAARPSDVRLLSISTPRQDLAQPEPVTLDRGLAQWGKTLPSILIDSNSAGAHQTLLRIVASYSAPKPMYHRVELKNANNIPLDRVDQLARNDLLLIGARKAADGSERAALGPFVSWPDPVVRP